MDSPANSEEQVVLVDEQDQVVGQMEKLEAHRLGVLHRAFSVFLFDSEGRLLLQQRAAGKYHSAGLWTNTCCSHPRPDETLQAAAVRRLWEEMGISAILEHRFSFLYRASFGNGLQEHELDHVFFGNTNAVPTPAMEEVQNWRYITMDELHSELASTPERFTVWLHHCWPLVVQHAQARRA